MPVKENVHSGHRARLRQRFLEEGPEGFQDHELLELLLFYCIPMRNTNELAHKLLKEFTTLSLLIEAHPRNIMARGGVNESTAVFFTAQNELLRRCVRSKWEKKEVIDSSKKAGELALDLLMGENYERFFVVCLDSCHRLIASICVSEGTVREAVVYPRSVVETALHYHSSSVILAHNHPGGNTKPSLLDIELTERIVKALNLIDIEVADHIIVTEKTYYSFAEKGMIVNEIG